MCEASEHAVGYVRIIEDYTNEETGETDKFSPAVFGSKRFTTKQMSPTMHANDFLAMHLAFDEFGHIFWATKKPIIVMTDYKAITRFLQAKHIQPSFWIFCDQTLQVSFRLTHVPDVENPNEGRLPVVPGTQTWVKITFEINRFYSSLPSGD